MKKLLFLFAALIPVAFVACESHEYDKTTVKLGFKAVGNTSENEKTLRSSSGEGIFIDTAIIILEKINLKKQGSADTVYNPGEFMLRGPYEIDLISKISKPEIPPAEISPGVYNLLQGMLFKPDSYDYTIHISGTYTRDINWWRFSYTYEKLNVFRAESNGGVEIAENLSNNVWVMIDVIALFDGVDFTNAITGAGKIIKINSVSNTDLGSIIENNFEAATEINVGNGASGGSENDHASGNNQDNGKVNGNKDPDKASGENNNNKDKNKNKDKDKNKNKKKDKVNNKEKNKDKDNKEKDKN